MGVSEQIWAVVVAGGNGTRFGERKQLASLDGRPLLAWAVARLLPAVDGVVLVVPADLVTTVASIDPVLADVVVVAGGASRSASVRAGLAALPPEAVYVLVHDAARPLTPRPVVDRVAEAVRSGAAAVVPVVPITDTLRRAATVDDGNAAADAIVDRSALVAVQTPQGFAVDVLRIAHEGIEEATDDARLVDRLGLAVQHVEGDPRNLKVTVPTDLAVASTLLALEDEA